MTTRNRRMQVADAFFLPLWFGGIVCHKPAWAIPVFLVFLHLAAVFCILFLFASSRTTRERKPSRWRILAKNWQSGYTRADYARTAVVSVLMACWIVVLQYWPDLWGPVSAPLMLIGAVLMIRAWASPSETAPGSTAEDADAWTAADTSGPRAGLPPGLPVAHTTEPAPGSIEKETEL